MRSLCGRHDDDSPAVLDQVCTSARYGGRHNGSATADDPVSDVGDLHAVEGHFSCEQLPQQDSESIAVHGAVILLVFEEFRGHIRRRACSGAGVLHEAKVGHFSNSIIRNQHIVRLQITMNDARLL